MTQLIKIVLYALQQGEESQNRWFYLAETPVLIEDLLGEFITQVVAAQTELCSADVSFTRVSGERIDGSAQSAISMTLENVIGQRQPEMLNTFDAWGFRLDTPNRVFRAGGKRVSGIAEQSFIQGEPEPGMDTFLIDYATAQTLVLGVAGGDSVDVLAKIQEGDDFYTVDPVLNASFTYITTQNSRKKNRGSGGISTFNLRKALVSGNGSVDDISGLAPTGLTTDTYETYLAGGGTLVGGSLIDGNLVPFS